MSTLFAGSAPRVLAAPPSAAFLDLLAERLIADATDPDDPFALADAIVFLPNRRAVRGLIDAFAAHTPAIALLPAIKPLGDIDDDPDVWGPAALDLALPPAIDPVRRRLELAALLRRRDEAMGGVSDPARAIAAAAELTKLLDAAAASDGVDWSRLGDLVQDRQLAEHWARSVEFLKIIADYWPQRLAADGLSEPGLRRNALLDALADAWTTAPPRTPVIIAGSTGSIPAVRRLMRVVAGLPKGVVILPGLDRDLDDAAWDVIGPQHPQYGLKITLDALGVDRRDPPIIAGGEETSVAAARRVLVREALVPADATADWLTRLAQAGGEALVREGLAGLSRVTCDTPEEEATVIALALREAIETPGRTAALVTPDAALARRVSAKLTRWQIDAPVSAGLMLRETPTGVLAELLLRLGADPASPLDLAALVDMPLATFGLAPEQRARAGAELLDELRGPRRFADLDALKAACKPNAVEFLSALEDALSPLRAFYAAGEARLDDIVQALALAIEAAAHAHDRPGSDRAWTSIDGQAAVRALRTLSLEGDALGMVSPEAAPRVVMALMGSVAVRPEAPDHPRLAIWGPLEARLQQRDLIVLGGLNEGVWPEPPPDDPFLSRAMREDMGLVSPDVRIGLAAHDFAQLACARTVLMTRAQKRDGAPTVASRWIWRLETLVRGAGVKEALDPDTDWLAMARALDAAERRVRVAPPQPRPPVAARPKKLRVTEVETLIRDPYAIYARRVLGLAVRDPVAMEAGAAPRGTAIHKALEIYSTDFEGGPARVLALIDQEMARVGFTAERRAIEQARLRGAAEAFVEWCDARLAAGERAFVEIVGDLMFPEGFGLRGRADRIDIGPDGRATIIDYKTGKPPTHKEVMSGFAPQLPLEGVMLAQAAFEKVPRATTRELVYWRFSGSDPEAITVKLDDGVEAEIARAKARFLELMTQYQQPTQPFLCKPYVKFSKEYADYDALARRREWANAEEAE